MSFAGWQVMHSLSQDGSVRDHQLSGGTAKRVLAFAQPYRRQIAGFLTLVVLEAVLVVATPLLLKALVDDGIIPKNSGLVVRLALVVAALAIVSAATGLLTRYLSASVGESLIVDLRRQVFDQVLKQPIGFFTRTQTGALVTRLGSDVVGAQQAVTSVLTTVVSNAVSLMLIVLAMLTLSPVLTLAALVLVPLFLVPARAMGGRLAALTHAQMGLNAELGTRTTERFNVAGALLVKIYGRYDLESAAYAERAARVGAMGVRVATHRSMFFVGLTLIAALATALVYGLGGVMAVEGSLSVGTLIALTALLARLYGPLTALSNARVDVMTALVSFERVFEVLDLEPLVAEADDAQPIPAGTALVEFDNVDFSHPDPNTVSLRSLEGEGGPDEAEDSPVLRGITVGIEPGQVVGVVGPSGAGKSTLAGLLARLYDPTSGVVRINGRDLRDATLDSVRDTVSIVTQEAHLFHDTIRANLRFAAPDATDAEMESALRSAQIWSLIERLPFGIDTIVGDRGHRLSGGEKQRIAIARLLLKGPELVVLDEATAHLDTESEAAVQRALDEALRGRTAVVIAHRLSTVRHADQIIVLDRGRIVERGTHEQLLDMGGIYADLSMAQLPEPSALPKAEGPATCPRHLTLT